ncbi:unnamed protein product [Heterobilharzia americana]|nr:unnamed protein product [Heterobilharzia americana]
MLIELTYLFSAYFSSIMNKQLVTCLFVLYSLYTSTNSLAAIIVEQQDNGQWKNMTWGCGVCLSGLSFIHYLLTDPYWRDVYTLTAENICDLIPSGRTKDACSIYITKYLQSIMDSIGAACKPDEICKNFQVCNSSEVEEYTIKTENLDSCKKCKSLSKQIYQMMKKTSFTERMKRPIQSGCSLFIRQEQHCTDYTVDLLNHMNKALHKHLDNICRVKICLSLFISLTFT